jgi:hypothetical protein
MCRESAIESGKLIKSRMRRLNESHTVGREDCRIVRVLVNNRWDNH